MTSLDQALVIFSGGQDSTTCLLQALATYGPNQVQAISFTYGQRHAIEGASCKPDIHWQLSVQTHKWAGIE